MIHRVWRRFKARRVTTTSVQNDVSHVLLLQLMEKTPGAVRAQHEMDKHPDSFHNNKARLFELIDFNDTFVNLALSLSPLERQGYVERLRKQLQDYCSSVRSAMFTEEQFEAITKGLSKEVAVYLGAREQGFGAEMTSRSQDAMGIDMVVTDPVTQRTLNIDCKTPSSYYFRVKDLLQQGRLSQEEAEQADIDGFVHEVNGQGPQRVPVTILRVDPNELGDITDFTFDDPSLLAGRLRTIFKN